MGKRGPAPTPNALKMAEGTYREDRHGGGVTVPDGVPVKPAWLGDVGSAMWDETVSRLSKIPGLLSDLDGPALALYCDAWEDFHDAVELLNEHGPICVGEKGGEYPHPALGMKNNARAVIAKYEAKFGLTASDRSALKINPAKQTGVRRRQA
jgi:P27 family predicted phage terminase small subunit